MPRTIMTRTTFALLCGLCVTVAASGQATSDSLAVKTVAEVESRVMQDGIEVVKLAPADRVAPGDRVVYTVEIRNVGSATVWEPVVTHPVPAHMVYVADSATGPGAEVSYSIDGGHGFDRPENLRILGAAGHVRQAIDRDYTHIRWKLKNPLKSNSVAFARFRAIVK